MWQAKVTSRKGNRKDLVDFLDPLVDLIREGDDVYISSSYMERVTDRGQVWRQTNSLLHHINQAIKLVPGIDLEIALDSVYEVHDDGMREVIPKASSIKLNLSDVRAIAPQRLSRAEKFKRAHDYARLVLQDPVALKILQLSQKELDPYTMYNIYEGIIENTGGSKQNLYNGGWGTEKEFKAFTAAVNRTEVFGDKGRHMFGNKADKSKPPKSQMTADEAKEFIRRLVKRWFQAKLAAL